MSMQEDRIEAAARALFEMPHNTQALGTCRIMARAALTAADDERIEAEDAAPDVGDELVAHLSEHLDVPMYRSIPADPTLLPDAELIPALRETRKALETLTRCIHEAHADGETFPIRVSVACHAADELLARTQEASK